MGLFLHFIFLSNIYCGFNVNAKNGNITYIKKNSLSKTIDMAHQRNLTTYFIFSLLYCAKAWLTCSDKKYALRYSIKQKDMQCYLVKEIYEDNDDILFIILKSIPFIFGTKILFLTFPILATWVK